MILKLDIMYLKTYYAAALIRFVKNGAYLETLLFEYLLFAKTKNNKSHKKVNFYQENNLHKLQK